MKNLMLLFILLFLFSSCSDTPSNSNADREPKSPIETFNDMKFGMFIHWGLYAVPGGIWEGEEIKGIGEWVMKRAEIPVKEYERLAEVFNPVEFDAGKWVQLAKDAGMQYMVITAKHHDGFAMYDSKASDFDIIDATPYDIDPMKKLSTECKEQGIRFGFYYSQAQDWHEPHAAGNTWDFPEHRDPEPYLQNKVFPQVDELLKNYGELALIWFDTPQLLNKNQVESLYGRVKELQPNCLVNSRIGYGLGDYNQLGDNQIPIEVRATGKKWEVPATLNDTWGFKYNDHNWKKPDELIFKLVDIISKGGNYLLNIGPDKEGRIPEESQTILRKVGAWVETNQEAIYKTGHSPFYPKGLEWRCTTRPYTLYFHILDVEPEIRILGLLSKVESAEILGGKAVSFQQNAEMLKLEIPEINNMTPPVIKVVIQDEKAKVEKGYAWDDPQEVIELPSRITRYVYEDLKYNYEEKTTTGFIPTGVPWPVNAIWWNLSVREESEYVLGVEYISNSESAGGEIQLSVEVAEGNKEIDQKYAGESVNLTTPVLNTEDRLKHEAMGNIHLHPGLNYLFKLKMDDSGKSAEARIKGLRLEKVNN